MTDETVHVEETETLDPTDWEAMRALGHRMIDDTIDYVRALRDGPPWRHAPEAVKAHFRTAVPQQPTPAEDVYAEFVENVLPYPIGNNHPRFWGWVFGTGTMLGAYAELLAAVMNTNSGDLDHHSAIHVETQVLAWLKELLGYPPEASGVLTSGCSAANLIGLAVARNAKAGCDVRRDGVGAAPRPLVLYASEEIHSSVQKAVELLGLGSAALRRVPVNEDYRIDVYALQAQIAADRAADLQPFCVAGAAGTTNTGACDDLNALADICAREALWLHVDGAFGVWAVLDPEVREQVAGLERADSIAFDLHKWMFMPYELGCVLVRDAEAHRTTFAMSPVYLARSQDGRGLSGGDLPWLTDYDLQLSRGFRALKAWMSLKEHGVEKYARLVRQNVAQCRHLAKLIEAAAELELAAPVTLNVVCFRFVNPFLSAETLDEVNREIVVDLQEQGIAVLSGTTLRGRYVLRVGHTNHRTRAEDFDVLVREVVRIGTELSRAHQVGRHGPVQAAVRCARDKRPG